MLQFVGFKMAACSEQDLEEKSVDERFPDSVFSPTCSACKKDVDCVGKTYKSEMPMKINSNEVDEQNKASDLKKLSDDEFQNLLEEVSTFNKPNSEESFLLKQLRKEVETDPCEDVNRSECTRGTSGRNKKSRNTGCVKSRGSHGFDGPDVLSWNSYSVLPHRVADNTGKKKNGGLGKFREDINVKSTGSTNSLGKSSVQSQSLQDLASDSISVRNAVNGRSMRKLQKNHRASSFSSSSMEGTENSVVELESFRTAIRGIKTRCNKVLIQNLPSADDMISFEEALTVHNTESRSRMTNISAKESETVCVKLEGSKSAINYKSLSSSLEKNDKLISHQRPTKNNCEKGAASLSWVDHKYSNMNVSKFHSYGEIQLKEIKRKNSGEVNCDHLDFTENSYTNLKCESERGNSKFYIDCNEVDNPVTFPLKVISSNGESIEPDTKGSNISVMGNKKCTRQLFPCNQRPVYPVIGCSLEHDSSSTVKSDHSNKADDKVHRKKKKNMRCEFSASDGTNDHGEGSKLCPIVVRYFDNSLGRVKSALLSMPASSMDRTDDSRQMLTTDINGNTFNRSIRPSIISTAVSDYTYTSNSSLLSDSQPSKLPDLAGRKNKRAKNGGENNNFILAENIEGHRGKDDIESLLKFINSSDKKGKSGNKGANGSSHGVSHLPAALNKSFPQEAEKRKDKSLKDAKNSKNMSIMYSLKKKCTSEINLDDLQNDQYLELETHDRIFDKNIPDTANCLDDNKANLDLQTSNNFNNSDLCSSIAPKLDGLIIFNSEQECSQSSSDTSPSSNSLPQSEISSFAADFYSVTEVSQQSFEESGFRVVKKKQRKRHQVKRLEAYRWHSAASRAGSSSAEREYYMNEQSSHSSSIILLTSLPLAQRNQCGKQDSRRKSTSSMPPSDHSSPDNSDLDSVHSLPVRGSAPHPTQPHPHTTPSSTSSTPQASYADIARMPISTTSKIQKHTAHSTSLHFNRVLLSKSGTYTNESEKENGDHSVPSTDFLKCYSEKCSLPKNSSLVTENHFLLPSYEEIKINLPSFQQDTTTNCKPGHLYTPEMKKTRENNTQTDPISSVSKFSHVCDNYNHSDFVDVISAEKTVDLLHKATSTGTLYLQEASTNSISCMQNSCDKECAFNEIDDNTRPHSFDQKNVSLRQGRPAVIIMGNSPPPENVCGVSFGIDLEELLVINSIVDNPPNQCIRRNGSHDLIQSASLLSSHSITQDLLKASEENYEELTSGVNILKQNNPSQCSMIVSGEQSKCGVCAQETPIQNEDCQEDSSKSSSPAEKLFLISGQPVHFQESEVNIKTFNYNQIVTFFGCTWNTVLKGCNKDVGSKEEPKIKYYSDC